MVNSQLLLFAPLIGIAVVYEARNFYADWCRHSITSKQSICYHSPNSTDHEHISYVKQNVCEEHEKVSQSDDYQLQSLRRKIDQRVQPFSNKQPNIRVKENAIPLQNISIILNEIKSVLIPKYGNKLDEYHVRSFEQRMAINNKNEQSNTMLSSTLLQKGQSNGSFYRHIQMISDYSLSRDMICAPWGSGDHIRINNVPIILRYLTRQAQAAFQHLGQLRHVYIEYSPTGLFYHYPKVSRSYDGLDYVVIPIRRDECDSVITMSPNARSKHSDLQLVMKHSWTNFDIDTLLQTGSMMRVFGQTRQKYGWGVRPGKVWFGDYRNVVNVQQPFATSLLSK